MANFYAEYPPQGVAGSNASVGPTGTTAPTFATEIGGVDAAGNLIPVAVTPSGDIITSPAPGTTTDVNLVEVGGAAISEGQKTSANSIPVVIASDQSAVPISAASLPLPTGASTSALQTTGNTSLASILANQTNGTQETQVTNFPATQPVSGTVTVVQPTGSNLHVDVDNFPATQPVSGTVAISNFPATQPISAVSLPLPTGAATSANQTSQITQETTTATNTTSILANQTNGTQITQVRPTEGTLTDDSGTTSATPSTSTQIMAANSTRKYLLIENVSTTNTLWVNFTSAATTTQPSFMLLPGGSIVQEASFISTEAVNVICIVASSPYTAKQA